MNNISIITARAADDLQARAAAGLECLGLKVGARVIFCVTSSVSLVLAIAGALRLGIVPVVVNPQLLQNERALIFSDADAEVIISSDHELASLFGSRKANLSKYPRARPMLYTSGTTGQPKGVWAGVLSDEDARKFWSEEIEQWSFCESDVHLVCSPLFHSAPIRFAICTWLAGGAVVALDGFRVDEVVATVEKFCPTTTFCTPAHLQRLDQANNLRVFASMRLVLHAGSPCNEQLKRRAIKEIGVDVLWEFYGSTEGQFSVCSSREWLERPGSVGRGRYGRSLSVESDGLIWCECPKYAHWEYWMDPKKTLKSWDGNKFTVGDIGRIDDDGYLFLLGRRDDLIITGGVNVYPQEIENVLRGCSGITDLVVFGRDNERWGSMVCAVVVGEATEIELKEYAERNLAPFKRPKKYDFVAEIPRSVLGKVRRSTMSSDLGTFLLENKK